ncbi:Nuclear transcription factor Y subunit B [Parasponia andersonii]|uniref:Nuclear transcription factor Y subunit B n=1 Tax=Parasponia andersonii TaxID=3476 RepID=A0A2P5C7Y8_PARAD|nr:Nuclear transcription factor Y subunit B [Parasponia andersonii]
MVDSIGNNREREGFSYNNCSSGANSSHDIDQDGLIKEQDRLLPIANVGRIMKQILPPNAKISKEAKETMQECVSEFISFVTGEASDKCHKEKRKTVNGDDIWWALAALGFDDYAEPLKRYLLRYRELEGERSAHGQNNNNKGSGINSTNEDVHEKNQINSTNYGGSGHDQVPDQQHIHHQHVHSHNSNIPLKFNALERSSSSFSRPF